MLFGGIEPERREQLLLAFQAPPDQNPVRILLATDAASEGIDLHEHCHRLVNYDIPFNPNKLEQRIGRIDRYGQLYRPEVRHFIGTGWESASDTYKADLEFLARIAVKVARMEEDLGAVNAVLAEAVQRRMLGEIADFDIENASAATKRSAKSRRLAADSDVSEQVKRLRRDLDTAVEELKVTPRPCQAPGRHCARAGRRAAAPAGHRRETVRRRAVRGARAHQVLGTGDRGVAREAGAGRRRTPPPPGHL